MNNQILSQDKCVVCGDQWKTRKMTTYETGAKSIPIIFGIEMLSHNGKRRINLRFCDRHGNYPRLRYCVKYTNKTGILKIRNVISHTWRTATKLGVSV